jgi:hypothetical protein
MRRPHPTPAEENVRSSNHDHRLTVYDRSRLHLHEIIPSAV